MATLKEYFLRDFATALTADFNWMTVIPPKQDISVKVGLEIISSAQFIVYYVPERQDYLQLFANLINRWPEGIKQAKNAAQVIGGFVGDINAGPVGSNHSVFAKRIYIYTENAISDTDISALDELCKTRSIWLTVRGNAYMAKKLELEKATRFYLSRQQRQNRSRGSYCSRATENAVLCLV